ncbi:MAG: D-glycero-beta-D-manno-heptose 1-phosphate adenylyltransferase [Bacteroidales bacterium]|nr:D-glycero-beta-D-manno-heptose 1-phosphate adenylyltransferase [Bacteroidales bacterium]
MNHVEHIRSKFLSLPQLLERLNAVREGKKVVFTNGCFDVIHRGHVSYLAQARDLGDLLVLGLNSDSSVRRLKGPTRPVNDEESRALVLASLECVDYVVLFDEDTPYRLIDAVQPDILVKGGDYQIDQIVGYDIVKAHGGEVLTLPFVDGFSSTSIINRLKQSS